MMRAALIAPIDNSLYARLVASELQQQEGVQLCGMLVRSPWSWKRLRGELGRDGARLLAKIGQKFLLGDERFAEQAGENLMNLVRQRGLQMDSLRRMAREHDIPYLQAKDINDAASQRFLAGCAPQTIAFTGGGLVRKPILSIPEIGVLNCHTGMLPRYRGMDVMEWTAAEGQIGSVGMGVSLHLMDAGVDSGAILLKRSLTPQKGESMQQVRARLEVLMVQMMVEGVCALRDGNVQPQAQEAKAGRQYYVMHSRVREFAERMRARQVDKR